MLDTERSKSRPPMIENELFRTIHRLSFFRDELFAEIKNAEKKIKSLKSEEYSMENEIRVKFYKNMIDTLEASRKKLKSVIETWALLSNKGIV